MACWRVGARYPFGLVLSRDAPLFGRARELLALEPIEPTYLHQVFGPGGGGIELVQLFTAWGGVPRYWELAADAEGSLPDLRQNCRSRPARGRFECSSYPRSKARTRRWTSA